MFFIFSNFFLERGLNPHAPPPSLLELRADGLEAERLRLGVVRPARRTYRPGDRLTGTAVVSVQRKC